MQHGFTEQEWMEFSEGAMGASSRSRLEAHLAVCAECAAKLDAIRVWHQRLSTEGERLRVAMELPEIDRERMLAQSLERIAAEYPSAERRGPAEALAALRALLGPVFGAGMIRAAVDAALERGAPGGINAASWSAFAAELREMIQPACGLAAGFLALRAAMSLAVADR
ncbi:MAG: hypothetical protein C5B51_15240 [Terriglobia bacterium]|nr:MAG: hypothetical protein C5B51_15240 [Terriglobia bacterium]